MFDRNSNSHAWAEERLSAYLDEQLAPLERAQLERHLRECAACRASLASLKWTVALVKQAPAPALPRTFVLPVPAKPCSERRSAPAFGFNFATMRLATVVATLLLIVVVGADLISQFGGATAPAMAPVPAARPVAQEVTAPTAVALAPPSPMVAKEAKPTTAPTGVLAVPSPMPRTPSAQPPVQPPAAEAPRTMPPAPAATRAPFPTAMLAVGAGAPETATAEKAAKAFVTTPSPPRDLAASVSVTATLAPTSLPSPSPTKKGAEMEVPTHTPTAVVPTATPPSPTRIALVPVEPTRALPPPRDESARPVVSPLRGVEVGLLLIAIFFGALTILLARRR